MRRIQQSFSGIRAFAVPFLLPADRQQTFITVVPFTVWHHYHCSQASIVRTDAHVATLAASQRVFAAAGARVHSDGLLDDKTIFYQLPDCLTCNTRTQINGRNRISLS